MTEENYEVPPVITGAPPDWPLTEVGLHPEAIERIPYFKWTYPVAGPGGLNAIAFLLDVESGPKGIRIQICDPMGTRIVGESWRWREMET